MATLYEIVNKTISSSERPFSWEWFGCAFRTLSCVPCQKILKSKQAYPDYHKLLFTF